MEERKIRNTINNFLNRLKEKELLLFHVSNLKKNYKRELTRLDFSDSEISASRKINSAVENQTLKLTPEELFAINLGSTLGHLIINLEDMKIRIFDFLNPKKIKIDDTPTFGVLMNRIADKLEYGEELRKELFDVFFVDLRNAIAHSDYEISNRKFSYKKKNGEIVEYKMIDLANVLWAMNEITRTILTFRGIDVSKGQIGSSTPYKT